MDIFLQKTSAQKKLKHAYLPKYNDSKNSLGQIDPRSTYTRCPLEGLNIQDDLKIWLEDEILFGEMLPTISLIDF